MDERKFTVKDEVDVASLAPVLLGFKPTNALVVVSFGKQVGTARYDLGGDPEPRMRAVVGVLKQLVQPDGVLAMIAYTEDPVLAAEAMLEVSLIGMLVGLNMLVIGMRVDAEDNVFEVPEDSQGGLRGKANYSKFTDIPTDIIRFQREY